MAMTTRCRMPPDSSCGYWSSRRSGSGMRTCRRRSSASARASALDRPRCTRRCSVSCRPTVKTGLSEVIGSWKIMPISLPRIVRMSEVSAWQGPWARRPAPGRTEAARPRSARRRIPPAASATATTPTCPSPTRPRCRPSRPGAISKLTSSTPDHGAVLGLELDAQTLEPGDGRIEHRIILLPRTPDATGIVGVLSNAQRLGGAARLHDLSSDDCEIGQPAARHACFFAGNGLTLAKVRAGMGRTDAKIRCRSTVIATTTLREPTCPPTSVEGPEARAFPTGRTT
jgi:hypothetical protein